MNQHFDELISLCRHPKIQEKRGKWQVGDRFYCEHCKGGIRLLVGLVSPEYLCCPKSDHLQYDCIWIPPLSNPLEPERSLIGMMNGLPFLYNGPTLEIAVCKAIIDHENYRIEGEPNV